MKLSVFCFILRCFRPFGIIKIELSHQLKGGKCFSLATPFLTIHTYIYLLCQYIIPSSVFTNPSMKKTVFFLSIIILVLSQTYTVDPNTSFLQDQFGRNVFIHGINSVYKQYPFYPPTSKFDPTDSLATEDFVNLKKWGFRSLRLYLAWQGFEPKEKQYNYTYLKKLKQIVRTAANYNISVIIDAHHDLYSRKFCGEGFPDWMVKVKTFPAPLKVSLRYDQNGNPLKEDCKKISFFKYYISEDVMSFSNDFFLNKNGMNDKFVDMWKQVVSFFQSEPNVLGYDLLNEPSGGNAWKNPYNFIGPGMNNNKYLLPFYKKLVAAIREIEKEKLILFEPSVVDYFGGFYSSPSQQYNNKNILSYHTYCPFKNDHAEPTSSLKCNLIDGLYMHSRYENIRRLKIGSMMTEFGSVPESQKGIEQIQRVLFYAQKNWQNWFYWQYKNNSDSTCSSNPSWEHSFYYPNGTVQSKKVHALSYPYAYAICGTPLNQTHSDSSYTLVWKPKRCQNRNTQIYLNEDLYFPKGFGVSFIPKCDECKLVGREKNFYQVVVGDRYLYSRLQLNVGANINENDFI